MFRLALIAIESGACVANPVYQSEKECFEQIDVIISTPRPSVQLATDVFGRKYIVPCGEKTFVMVVEPVEEED